MSDDHAGRRTNTPMKLPICDLFALFFLLAFCLLIIIFFFFQRKKKMPVFDRHIIWILIIVRFSLIELHDIFYVFFFSFGFGVSRSFSYLRAYFTLRFWHNCMFHVPFWQTWELIFINANPTKSNNFNSNTEQLATVTAMWLQSVRRVLYK